MCGDLLQEVSDTNRLGDISITPHLKSLFFVPTHGVGSHGNKGLDDYGHAERHYPTMSIAELCDMGDEIKAACENDAVLFLWVTSPDAFTVIKAWSFGTYGGREVCVPLMWLSVSSCHAVSHAKVNSLFNSRQKNEGQNVSAEPS